MLCVKCGYQLCDAACFCCKCGADAAAPANGGEPQQAARPEPPRYQHAQSYSSPPSNYKPIFTDEEKANKMHDYNKPINLFHPYNKLGGWLGFFVVCWIINAVRAAISGISDLSHLIDLADSFGYDSSFALGLSIILVGNGLILFTYIKIIEMVVRKKARFLLFYEVTNIVAIAFYVLLVLVFNEYVDAGDIIFIIIMSVISLAIMLNYFSKSFRVRTYFGSDEYLRRSFFFKYSVTLKPADTTPFIPASDLVCQRRGGHCRPHARGRS